MESKAQISNLYQTLFGVVGDTHKEIKRFSSAFLAITILITVWGGIHEFRSDGVSYTKDSLATIEHFANAIPFSIFVCLIVMVGVDRIRGIKMRYSDRVRQEIEEEVTRKVTERVTERVTQELTTKWVEWARDNNIRTPQGPPPPPPWETHSDSTDTQTNQ